MRARRNWHAARSLSLLVPTGHRLPTIGPIQMADSSLADAYDIIIVGSGMGGGTLAYALRDSGARILLIERGDFIPSEP